ncbi:MAG TPA: AI-2E family transporter, partial [Thermodesulfovibrionales bacterium]|nr:AI-2E family transporter [Thermodesulfovibrionales bacterium]
MTVSRRSDDSKMSDFRKLHHQMPRWVIVLLVVGVAALVASRISHILMTLTVAAVVAYIFSSVVSGFEKLGIKRSVAVVKLFVLAAVFVLLAEFLFAPYLKQEVKNAYEKFPEFSAQIESALLSTAKNSEESSPAIAAAINKISENAFGANGFLEKTLNASEILSQASPFIMGSILVPFFAFFLLMDWPGVLRRVIDWVPPSYVETTLSVIAEINILIGKYLRGLAADCFFIGVLASLGLWVIGINYPIMLGILSGIANIIPYFGPIVGCTVSCLVALMQFNSFDSLLNVVLLYVVIKLLDDLVIQPLMIGKSVKLHPMLLVITIVAGEKLFGISGMIFGVPVVTAAQKTVS